MLQHVLIGCALIIMTTVIHAGGMAVALRLLRISRAKRWAKVTALTGLLVVSALVLIMFAAGVIEAGVWAATYLFLGAMSDFGQAMYFSMVTYTTLGYGDVVITDRWRMLASFEAANGIIMFGWTTALIVAAVQHLYFHRGT